MIFAIVATAVDTEKYYDTIRGTAVSMGMIGPDASEARQRL
ncbi:hypothetical protein GDI3714 [Gluconacetobacter diazotrophicus PA1 5]|uniref:Uncharacterized protein n=1 Tax=Gluconacetobacter diazotrophicus (strain ATCC 49037 / DSM 5601 / CCUG 37298 / CIP 103539 / LMG 7603 / PAl5) TaxID=272568 RepID=A9H7L6_GLUDA|nr:hypothetical protein GDI3714 [Gluconacetobacter diazotrophicus PA1 5]